MTEPIKFLDAYVMEASPTIGSNGSNSSCQMRLLEDPDNGVNIDLPTSGTACILTIADFQFGGILQRRNYEESTQGRIWDVTLETPQKVLEGVSVILDDFQGDGFSAGTSTNIGSVGDAFTNQVKNVWNPFAIKENYDFGGDFGNANVNSFGFPASTLLTLLEEISRGEHDFGGKIKYGETEYTLDLTELKNVVPDEYRVKGPVQSLGSILRDIADVSVVDFIVTVEGTTDSRGVITSDAKIKAKVMDRSEQPQLGVVSQKIIDFKNEKNWVSSSDGRELSDAVTQKVVIGGQATRYWRAKTLAGNVFPIWGKLRDSSYLVSPLTDESSLDTLRIPIVLENGQQYSATPLEIWCAMAGREAWAAYKVMKGDTDIISKSAVTSDVVSKIQSGEATPLDLYNTAVRDREYLSAAKEDRNYRRLFDGVASAGGNFWGKQFFVKLPVEPGGIGNNLKFVEEDKDYISSWEITSSAWVEDKPFSDISFYDGEGKLKPTVTYPFGDTNIYDYSSFGSDYSLGFSGISTFNGVSIDDKIYWRKDLQGNSTAMVLVTVPQVPYYSDETRQEDGLFQIAKLVFGLDPDTQGAYFAKAAGYEGLKFTLPPLPIMPLEIGIPQVSRRYTYGPWYSSTQDNGKAEIVQDTNLRPEVFGSSALMDQAAESVAYVANTNLGEIDNGNIKVTGNPQYSLADRFTSQGPYITSISMSWGTSGYTTQYTFDSFTKQAGKLEKYNYDRLSNIQKNTIRSLKEIRDLYTLPPIDKPIPKPPINRRVPSEFYNGYTLFMQRYNPFTGKKTTTGTNADEAANNAKEGSDGATTHTKDLNETVNPVVSRRNPEGDDDTESIETKKPEVVDDDGLFDGGSLHPTGKELNPNWAKENVQRGATIADTPVDLNPDIQEPQEKIYTLADSYPRTISGWGFDVNGLPVPAIKDGEGNPTGQFDSEAGQNIKKNKVGPVELRWHKKRQVWTSMMPIVEGTLTASIGAPTTPSNPNEEGRMKIFRGEGWHFDAEDSTGEPEIGVIVNRDPSLSVDIDEADGDVYVMCVEINYELRPIYVGCV